MDGMGFWVSNLSKCNERWWNLNSTRPIHFEKSKPIRWFLWLSWNMQLELQIEWMFRLVMVADLSKKGMVGEKTQGGKIFWKKLVWHFSIVFLLHWVTLQKRRVWVFQGKLLCFSREHFYHWWTVYCYQQIARRHRNSNHFDELAPQSCFPRVLYWV